MIKLYIGSDHAGLDMKEKIKSYLKKKNIELEDIGAITFDKNDDYPDYAFKLGEKVAKDKKSRGIIICGSGQGVGMAANKVKGVRAAIAYDIYSAKMSRLDNDSNVLALNGRRFSFEKTKKIVNTWLSTSFSGEKRHERRIREISNYENRR